MEALRIAFMQGNITQETKRTKFTLLPAHFNIFAFTQTWETANGEDGCDDPSKIKLFHFKRFFFFLKVQRLFNKTIYIPKIHPD